jgi:hypothetical protein
MMNRLHFMVRMAGCTLLVTGCQILDPKVCTSDFRFGLIVHVRDSISGAPAASGASLEARSILGVDTASFPAGRPEFDASPLQAAGERPGIYDVTVRKAGYRDWTQTGVRVTADECHVRPTRLTAQMQRVP